jgi:ribosomal-protein-alanine N-acetyltransferase
MLLAHRATSTSEPNEALAYDRGMGSAPASAMQLAAMRDLDVPEVLALEREAFSVGWPPTAFAHELQQNRLARYIVVRELGALVGFAGLWLMVEEAHIVTVAVAPDERRRGFGRLLVHGLLRVAQREGMLAGTLEVRESNAEARALYREYGFHEVGRRKRYYVDNGEDAVIMTTEDFATGAFQERLSRLGDRLEAMLPGAAAALAEV